ncbi:MAG: hypothetical protein ACK5KT_07230 [Dysgonomonas sp.]
MIETIVLTFFRNCLYVFSALFIFVALAKIFHPASAKLLKYLKNKSEKPTFRKVTLSMSVILGIFLTLISLHSSIFNNANWIIAVLTGIILGLFITILVLTVMNTSYDYICDKEEE